MRVGCPIWVASSELAVADVYRDHELVADHDVHGDEVALECLDATVPVVLVVAPVVLEVEQRLSLLTSKDNISQDIQLYNIYEQWCSWLHQFCSR